jgi:hypothetical protein
MDLWVLLLFVLLSFYFFCLLGDLDKGGSDGVFLQLLFEVWVEVLVWQLELA